MTERDDAMQRRAAEIEEALQGRGGGSVRKFDAHLHPHDRVGKFRETFTDAHPEANPYAEARAERAAISADNTREMERQRRTAAPGRGSDSGALRPRQRPQAPASPARRAAVDPDALTRALQTRLGAQGRTTTPSAAGPETGTQAPHDPIRDRRADGGLRAPADVPNTALIGSPGRSSAGRLRNFRAMSDAKLVGVIAQLRSYRDPEALAAAEAELGTRGVQEARFTASQRKRLSDSGSAMDDGSFPIRNARDLGNAVQALGRAKDKAKAKAHIIARAKALKLAHKLPDDWHVQEAVDMHPTDRDRLIDRQTERFLIAEASQTMALELREAKGSLAKASTPEPFSTSKTSNWVARNGGLPDYIQHVAHGLVRSGKPVSKAIEMAIGIVKRWARGGGNVDAETKAAAAKAVAEWEALKAKAKARKAA